MSKKRVCIDISNVIPGKGGSGGGIATYAMHLIKGLDESFAGKDFQLYIIIHPEFKGFENLKNTSVKNIRINNKLLLTRIYWTHFYLPVFCIKNKIKILHRVNPELPSVKVCKYVCTLHDLMFEFYLSHNEIKKFLNKKDVLKYKLFNLISRHAARISDYTIVPSYAIKNELVNNYKIKNDKVIVTHLASEKINNINMVSEKKDKIYHFGVIAGFYPHKGHKRVMQLAKKFIENGFTNFEIGFRGNPAFSNYIEEIKKLINDFQLSKYVFIVPYEQKASLQEIYSSFDIILLMTEYEGFGLPVLEAQAYNIPVFCSDIPVFREVLEDSAYFISEDVERVNILKLIENINNPALLNSLKEKGKVNLEKFSWQKMTNETNEVYDKLLHV